MTCHREWKFSVTSLYNDWQFGRIQPFNEIRFNSSTFLLKPHAALFKLAVNARFRNMTWVNRSFFVHSYYISNVGASFSSQTRFRVCLKHKVCKCSKEVLQAVRRFSIISAERRALLARQIDRSCAILIHREFSSGVHGPEHAVWVSLNQDGAKAWLRSLERVIANYAIINVWSDVTITQIKSNLLPDGFNEWFPKKVSRRGHDKVACE